MKLQQFFEAQERLDNKVVEVHNLKGQSLTANVTMALFVELGELANEIEFFKHWKKNKRNNKDKQWDEWADCWHFLISLGNKYGHSDKLEEINTNLIYGVHEAFDTLYKTDFSRLHEYMRALRLLVTIGKSIGMTEEDMSQTYFTKNQTNYERLASGY
ncbi:dUTP diphosphatase [Ectobacillus antri]|uniref:dUTP diphosphatase n=1 Tax=Ectobacillus antri TaxID=2486280 RepID=UPI000F5B1781|nr:dUTP diphosphatase [Ectobacillus antri]